MFTSMISKSQISQRPVSKRRTVNLKKLDTRDLAGEFPGQTLNLGLILPPAALIKRYPFRKF